MTTKLKQASLLFLIKDNSILLAMKKRGFGKGRWNGVGGKPNVGEHITQTAIRECQEEILVNPLEVKHVATLDFYFPADKSDWDQQVIVYLCSKWDGDPVETEEMKPIWYKISEIPYEKMWQDDKYWLPLVLADNYVQAKFIFDGNDDVLDYKIHTKPARR